MSGNVSDLDAPLRDVAEELGIEELRARLTDPNRQRELDHVHDFICPECYTGITNSDNLGELGHLDDCSRRAEKYYGKRSGPSQQQTSKKDIGAGQSTISDFDQTVRADGGVRR